MKQKIGLHTIAYKDVGQGDPVVFVHGTPTSSADFEPIIQALQPQFRCVAIDHLGFGESDKPPEADYSLPVHSINLKKLLSHLEIGQFHLVVHDFGGVIALALALEDWSRIKSLTLINTWAWPFEQVDSKLKVKLQKWCMSSALMKHFYLEHNFSANKLIPYAWGKHRPLKKEEHQMYCAPFKTRADRIGTWRFVQAICDKDNPAWSIGRKLKKLQQKPTLILWGEQDKLVSMNSLKRWQQNFPHAETHVFKDVGHFVPLEAPELVTDRLRGFLAHQHTGNNA